MLKKYSILYGIIIPMLLLLMAALYCQGRSRHDKSSIGYARKSNHQSDLLNEKAVNVSNNCTPVLGYFQDVVLMRRICFTPF
jgi:hypothetical protein